MKTTRTVLIVILAALIIAEAVYLYMGSSGAGQQNAPASPQASTTAPAALDSLSSPSQAGSVPAQSGSVPKPAPILNSLSSTTTPKASSSGANSSLLDSLKAK